MPARRCSWPPRPRPRASRRAPDLKMGQTLVAKHQRRGVAAARPQRPARLRLGPVRRHEHGQAQAQREADAGRRWPAARHLGDQQPERVLLLRRRAATRKCDADDLPAVAGELEHRRHGDEIAGRHQIRRWPVPSGQAKVWTWTITGIGSVVLKRHRRGWFRQPGDRRASAPRVSEAAPGGRGRPAAIRRQEAEEVRPPRPAQKVSVMLTVSV